MFKKLIVLACLMALALPMTSYAVINEVCIGENYPQGVPVEGVTPPTVIINSPSRIIDLKGGETLELATTVSFDENQISNPMYQWCSEGNSKLFSLNNDYSEIRYTAPYLPQQHIVPVVVTVGDGLGYVNGDTVFIRIAPTENPNPIISVASGKYKIQVKIRDRNNRAIGNAQVLLIRDRKQTSNHGGHVHFEKIAAANYVLSAIADGYICNDLSVKVGAKPVAHATVSCYPARTATTHKHIARKKAHNHLQTTGENITAEQVTTSNTSNGNTANEDDSQQQDSRASLGAPFYGYPQSNNNKTDQNFTPETSEKYASNRATDNNSEYQLTTPGNESSETKSKKPNQRESDSRNDKYETDPFDDSQIDPSEVFDDYQEALEPNDKIKALKKTLKKHKKKKHSKKKKHHKKKKHSKKKKHHKKKRKSKKHCSPPRKCGSAKHKKRNRRKALKKIMLEISYPRNIFFTLTLSFTNNRYKSR